MTKCTRKPMTEAQARVAATRIGLMSGNQAYPVPCSICNAWHVSRGAAPARAPRAAAQLPV